MVKVSGQEHGMVPVFGSRRISGQPISVDLAAIGGAADVNPVRALWWLDDSQEAAKRASGGLDMADHPSREEMNAKLEAVEARLETRLTSIDVKLDRIGDRVETAVEQSRDAKTAANDARSAATSTKWNILFTAIGVATVLIAAWAIMMQGMEMIGTLLSAPGVSQ